MRELHRTCLIVTLILVLVLSALPAAATGIDEIPNPRPAGWVTDVTGTLSPATMTELNRLGDEALARNGAELKVVVIGTTGGVDSNAFATRLFNTWGIGKRGKDNGLLLFVALEDRAAEIVLGDGLASSAAYQASGDIMHNQMKPRFQAGDPEGAILQGARACAERILNDQVPAPAAPASAIQDAEPQPIASSASTTAAEAPETDPGLPFAMYVWVGALVGVLSIGLWVANRPVRCKRCKEEMILLSESEDDAHLASDERIEERIGSVNYEIWHCPGCGAIQRSRFARIFSPYKKCPGCSAKTLSVTSSTILVATEYYAGLVRFHRECAHCSFQDSFEQATPILMGRTVDYGSDRQSGAVAATLVSSSFVSDSSSSSFSSSPSDSGGGGHSSGGGASGHW